MFGFVVLMTSGRRDCALSDGAVFCGRCEAENDDLKFGADQQRLQGEARDAFLKKCMEDRDDPGGPAPSGAVTAPK
jgi:hypothetical protein